jgi:hypothetical protein
VKDKGEKGKPKALGDKTIEFGENMARNMAMEGGKKLASQLVTLGINWYSSGS